MGKMKEEFIKMEEKARDDIAWWIIEEQIEQLKKLQEKLELVKEYISKEEAPE